MVLIGLRSSSINKYYSPALTGGYLRVVLCTALNVRIHQGKLASHFSVSVGGNCESSAMVAHDLPKVGVAGSSPVSRSTPTIKNKTLWQGSSMLDHRSTVARPTPEGCRFESCLCHNY